MNENEWLIYVDKILDEQEIGERETVEIRQTYKEWGLGEYARGVDPEELKAIINNLEVGDLMTFRMKGSSRWAMNFLALFNTRKTCFQYVKDQLISWEHINRLAFLNSRIWESFEVTCKVIDTPISKAHTVDWIVKYIGICVQKVTVSKAD